MRIVAYDPYPDASYQPGPDFAWVGSIEEVLGTADVVTLHCPPSAKPMIDAAALDSMKNGAILINTARASLIDLGAVEAALQSGRVAGFATDVFPQEPPESNRVYDRDDVIVTPHIGGSSFESAERSAVGAAEKLIAFLRRETG
jgi:phosphoglycerate dehydrogenase-like enzyme